MSRRVLAWSPLRKLMKEAGAEIVSKEGAKLLLGYLEGRARAITDLSFVFAKHSKRKKITQSDVELAIQNLDKKKIINADD